MKIFQVIQSQHRNLKNSLKISKRHFAIRQFLYYNKKYNKKVPENSFLMIKW
jgi:hypothetical protein